MAEETRHPDGRIEHPRVHYEHSDASFHWVLGFVIGAAILGFFIRHGVLLYFNHSRDQLAESRKSSFPLAVRPSGTLPPEPRLEQLDYMKENTDFDVFARQKAKSNMLNAFGPTGEQGFVHIPIDRAMELLANKLPVRKQGVEANAPRRDNGLVSGGASNSGRLLNRRSPRWNGR
jgi:hypothetical protein